MKTNHTPGPWRVSTAPIHGLNPLAIECGEQADDLDPRDTDYHRIAILTDRWDAEWQANARLMAAAPALLARLQALVFGFDHNLPKEYFEGHVAAARAEIAAATGE